MFRSTQKQSVTDETFDRILQIINTEGYVSGDKLPGERELSKQLNVGRTSLREAISRLEAFGLLEIRQGIGTFVKNPSTRILQSTLVPHILQDQKKLGELFETRKIIETAAASLAAQRRTPLQIMQMKHWMQENETGVARNDNESIKLADVEFHRQIIGAANNETLAALVDSLADLLSALRYDSNNIPDLFPTIISGHRAIMTAIEAGESEEAGQAMQNHLDEISIRVKEFWQIKNEPKAGEVE